MNSANKQIPGSLIPLWSMIHDFLVATIVETRGGIGGVQCLMLTTGNKLLEHKLRKAPLPFKMKSRHMN